MSFPCTHSAGIPACCIADIPVGRRRGVSRFGRIAGKNAGATEDRNVRTTWGGRPARVIALVFCALWAWGAAGASDSDVVMLRDGTRLSGTVTNRHFTLRTAFAGLELEARALATIDLGADLLEFTVLTTANTNRFTGFLEDQDIGLAQKGRGPMVIRREKIARITFGDAGTNAMASQSATWLRLRNGDFLSGRLSPDLLPMTVTNSQITVPISDVRLLTFRADAPSGACRINLHAGGVLQAVLGVDYVDLQLDLGLRIKLHTGYIERLGEGGAVLSGLPVEITAADVSSNSPPGLSNLIWIPPGEFTMGSKYDEKGRDLDEGPPTRMTIAEGFWMGRCEVTQAEYEKVTGANPSNSTDDPNLPVEKVSWTEAMQYCQRLTESTRSEGRLPEGYAFRLPTEAEWEYACRAGTSTRFCCGDDLGDSVIDSFAWTARNSNFRTNPVGKKKPNTWGLHDMHGNVWEWCLDRWERSLPGGSQTNKPVIPVGGLRAARGGSWLYDSKSCRSANRDDYGPSNRCSDIGFRVVLAREP